MVELWSLVNSEVVVVVKGVWVGVKFVYKVFFLDILVSSKRNAFLRKWISTDIMYVSFIGVMYFGCLFVLFIFIWGVFKCFLVMYFIIGCFGITLSYYR